MRTRWISWLIIALRTELTFSEGKNNRIAYEFSLSHLYIPVMPFPQGSLLQRQSSTNMNTSTALQCTCNIIPRLSSLLQGIQGLSVRKLYSSENASPQSPDCSSASKPPVPPLSPHPNHHLHFSLPPSPWQQQALNSNLSCPCLLSHRTSKFAHSLCLISWQQQEIGVYEQ